MKNIEKVNKSAKNQIVIGYKYTKLFGIIKQKAKKNYISWL